jgi:H+-transporting ATPase
MPDITAAAVVIGVCKLGFSTAMLTMGAFRLRLGAAELQTLALVTLVFGNQALLYVLRERQHMWSSWPSSWVLASSALDIALVSLFALSGVMMEPLNVHVLAANLLAAAGFALILDWIKGPVLRAFKVGKRSTPRD